MFRKMLYPTDFSDCATKALEYVKKLSDCTVLAEDKYRGARDTLVSLLESSGNEV